MATIQGSQSARPPIAAAAISPSPSAETMSDSAITFQTSPGVSPTSNGRHGRPSAPRHAASRIIPP